MKHAGARSCHPGLGRPSLGADNRGREQKCGKRPGVTIHLSEETGPGSRWFRAEPLHGLYG